MQGVNQNYETNYTKTSPEKMYQTIIAFQVGNQGRINH